MSLRACDISFHAWVCGAKWVWCPVPALSKLPCDKYILFILVTLLRHFLFIIYWWGIGEEGGLQGREGGGEGG